MNEREIAKKIAGYLDRGTADLKAGTAYKLQLARQKALAQLSEPRRAPELAGGGRRHSFHPVLAIGPAGARHRGNRCCDPVLRAASRSLSGWGIPGLAQALRALIAATVLAVAVGSSPAAAVAVGPRAPSWAELSPADKQVLAPLSGEWDSLDAPRRQKWLGIAKRYPKLAPDEQQRVQQQMSTWAHLTPEQRNQARQQYKTIKQLPPDQRQQVQQKWQEYQQLPPEKRRELTSRGAAPPQPSGAPTKASGGPPQPPGAPPQPSGTPASKP